MRIAGLQKLTLLDFPDKTAMTLFCPGCNLRCPFCHNAELIGITGEHESRTPSQTRTPEIAPKEFFTLLESRAGLIDGVCITGGEPLLQSELEEFCLEIKERGFLVKLDTNGCFPSALRNLVEAKAIDYVALDAKNCASRYAETVGISGFDSTPIFESIDYLLHSSIEYEFRTTLVKELHDLQSLSELASSLKGARRWYLQSFVDGEGVLAGEGTLHSFTKAELDAMHSALRRIIPTVALRGV
ncbi:MAG: anaerobic ribonucleoside-triphosphate reductase activating protein [Raoultibacter sp.]|jgi:pyruvate formate lyase activating enzyme